MNLTGKYTKHGLSHSRVRNVWKHMLARCSNPQNRAYHWYGGRGITVCDRWLDLRNFVSDMGHPLSGMTIDRINNDGNYEPSNCRWATYTQQARNRSSNPYLEFRGQKKLISDWAVEVGIKHCTLTMRLKAGLSVEEALTRPIGRWA